MSDEKIERTLAIAEIVSMLVPNPWSEHGGITFGRWPAAEWIRKNSGNYEGNPVTVPEG